jgi:mycofactocin precursor
MISTAEQATVSLEDLAPDGERRAPEAAVKPAEDRDLVVEDLLVEDVSIDGMCGVY